VKGRNLTKEEEKAVDKIKLAFRNFPSSLMIFDFSGTLLIVDFKTKQVFDRIIGVHSDGGDPGTVDVDGFEFLDFPQS
jgi:hypothetical protein